MPFSRLYKLHISSEKLYFRKLKILLGFIPGNLNLYRLAFRHKSVAVLIKKNGNGAKNSNERMEFLGDAILGSVIAAFLFKKYPFKDEGFLTEMRSKIVSRSNLNQLARKMGLDEFIEYDSKMMHFSGKPNSMMGDAFEALIGAVYLDKGYLFTRNFILDRIVDPLMDIQTLERTEMNFKSRLIEWCQQNNKEVEFKVVKNDEGESAKLFTVEALIGGSLEGIGREYSKKNAEKLAAEKACTALKIL